MTTPRSIEETESVVDHLDVIDAAVEAAMEAGVTSASIVERVEVSAGLRCSACGEQNPRIGGLTAVVPCSYPWHENAPIQQEP